MGFGDSIKGIHSWTLDEGIIFFGTAIAYQNGTSEKYLGRAIKKLAKC